MKVYVVTAGCYSDYHIEAVFTDPVLANEYANIDSERQIEKFEADSMKVATSGIKARIRYAPKKNEITEIDTSNYVQGRYSAEPDAYDWYGLRVYRKLSARTLKDVKQYGMESPLLLKIMQDAWAIYKAEHMLEEAEEEDEDIYINVSPEEAAHMMQNRVALYNAMFARSSMETGDVTYEHD